jgi:two-component system NtrC family sensor kinase
MGKKGLRDTSLTDILQDGLTSQEQEGGASAEEARTKQALLERPRFSIKARLTLIFLVFLLVSAAVSIVGTLMLSRIDYRVRFVSLADKFANEIQSARRSEKNYLLYNSDLAEISMHLDSATAVLEQAALELGHVVGRAEIDSIRLYLTHYRTLLETLQARENEPDFKSTDQFAETSQLLRASGSRILSLSLDISRKERIVISQTIVRAKRVQIALLVVLLAFSVFTASYLSRHIISRLRRLMTVTQQFASGDMLPLTPQRKYKDEFSQLAIALNHMMFELQRRQNMLVESHKLRAIGNLTAGIAHELNNPLNNIILTSEMLKDGYPGLSDAECKDMINDLVTQGERAQQVVKNLLDFARESETETEYLYVNELIEETVRLAKNQIRLSKIEFKQEMKSNLPPIYGDRKLLIQVFLNLLLNAIDAMKDGGVLTISVSEEKQTGFLDIRISDTGYGIPNHILGSIFTPFFTTKPTGKGTGLGLAVSRGIIEKHGGSIEVESKVGEGTTFTIRLPIVPIPADIRDRRKEE